MDVLRINSAIRSQAISIGLSFFANNNLGSSSKYSKCAIICSNPFNPNGSSLASILLNAFSNLFSFAAESNLLKN